MSTLSLNTWPCIRSCTTLEPPVFMSIYVSSFAHIYCFLMLQYLCKNHFWCTCISFVVTECNYHNYPYYFNISLTKKHLFLLISNITALYTDADQCFCINNILCLLNFTVSRLCYDDTNVFFLIFLWENTKVAARFLFNNKMNASPAYLWCIYSN